MNRKAKILVVGSFVMDFIVSTPHFPNEGETVLGTSYRTAPGGKGANQAVQAARLGADVTMAGCVGNDDFGKKLVAACRRAGIHTEHVRIDESVGSAVGNVQLENGGGSTRNRIIVVPGANMSILPEHLAFLEDAIAGYDMVILQLEIPMEINELVADMARRSLVPVMLNPAPSAPLAKTLLSGLTYLSPNEHEAAALTGITIRKNGEKADLDDVRAAATAFLDRGVRNVIITLGNAGAALVNRSEFLYEPCADAAEAVDPTAAGDSFVGAFSTAVSAGLDHREALHFASYAASLTVSRMGAQPSLPTLKEILGQMRKQNDAVPDLSLLGVSGKEGKNE